MKRLFPIRKSEEVEIEHLHHDLIETVLVEQNRRNEAASRAVLEAAKNNDLELLRLYHRYLPEYRTFDIENVVAAKMYAGFHYPYDTITDECMATASAFHKALIYERANGVEALDSQSLTVLLSHVMEVPDELEPVLSIIMDGRARGYRSVLQLLGESNGQVHHRALNRGFL